MLGALRVGANNYVFAFLLTGGLRLPDPKPWIPGSIYYSYPRYYMDHTIPIILTSQTLYGPDDPYLINKPGNMDHRVHTSI